MNPYVRAVHALTRVQFVSCHSCSRKIIALKSMDSRGSAKTPSFTSGTTSARSFHFSRPPCSSDVKPSPGRDDPSQPQPETKKERLPPLSDLPHILWPSFFKTIRNFILSAFIIRPYLDQEFYASEFMRGAKQALVVISDLMSSGRYEDLKGLVTEDCLAQVRERLATMSVAQRTSLAVEDSDVYLAFPYQIGMIIYDETTGIQKRFVEITVAYHVFRGLKDMLEAGNVPRDPFKSAEYKDKIMVCNYRFIREYTKGVSDTWTVNKLNHFRPADWM